MAGTKITQLGPHALPQRRYGSFAGRAVAAAAAAGLTLYLVELDLPSKVAVWTEDPLTFDETAVTYDSTSLYWTGEVGIGQTTLDADSVARLSAVKEGGTALTSVGSVDAVRTTQGSYYLDPTTYVLSVHTTDSASPSTKGITLTLLEPLCFGKSIVKTRSGVDLFWDGRVGGLPLIEQDISTEDPGVGSAMSVGELEVQNQDGRYDVLAFQRAFKGGECRIYRGKEEDPYTSFTLWLKALVDTFSLGPERFVVRLSSLARRLDTALLTSTFAAATYPSMDAQLEGVAIPRVWGTVVSAEAFRVAGGRWKLAGHAMTSIDAARKSDGTTVSILTTDLPNGEFTASGSLDSESRLYVDCRGVALDKPGALMKDVCLTSGLVAGDIDSTAMDTVDSARAVNIGLQVLSGSTREVLDRIASASFVDWFVNRSNQVTALVRRRDQGNVVGNSTFESDLVGWTGEQSATLTRITSPVFRGTGAMQIDKPASATLSRAVHNATTVKGGARYRAQVVVTLVSGTTAAFRLGLTDTDGTEYLSDVATLTAGQWKTVGWTPPALTATPLGFDSTSIAFDDTGHSFSEQGGEFRIYPEQGGGGAVVVAVDEVVLTEALLLDDTNAWLRAMTMPDLVLYRARAGYGYDGRLQTRRYAAAQDTAITQVMPTAESRQIDGDLRASADGQTVADAMLDYYRSPRVRVLVELLETDTPATLGMRLDLQTTRKPTGIGLGLYQVVRYSERQPASDAVPRVELEAEAQYDPALDPSVSVPA